MLSWEGVCETTPLNSSVTILGVSVGQLIMETAIGLRFCGPPQGHLVMSEDVFGYHAWGDCYWHHLVGRRAGTSLNVFHGQGQPPPQRVLQPQMPLVQRWTDPGLESPIAEESSWNTWIPWSHFLEDCGKQRLKEDWFLPTRTRVGSVLGCTDMPYSFRTTQIV